LVVERSTFGALSRSKPMGSLTSRPVSGSPKLQETPLARQVSPLRDRLSEPTTVLTACRDARAPSRGPVGSVFPGRFEVPTYATPKHGRSGRHNTQLSYIVE
jgi:hypothetical protein